MFNLDNELVQEILNFKKENKDLDDMKINLNIKSGLKKMYYLNLLKVIKITY